MANQKLTELTANTAPLDTDLMYMVDDPDGTELSQKIQFAYVRQAWLAFSQTATVTVASTAAETTLIGAGLGSPTLIAAYFNAAGRTLKWKAWGIISDTGTPTMNWRVKFGATVLATTGDVTLGSGIANVQWELEAYTVCRTTGAAGTVWTHGRVRVDTTTYVMNNTAVSGAIDLTAAIVCDHTADWGTSSASNTVSAHIVAIGKEN